MGVWWDIIEWYCRPKDYGIDYTYLLRKEVYIVLLINYFADNICPKNLG